MRPCVLLASGSLSIRPRRALVHMCMRPCAHTRSDSYMRIMLARTRTHAAPRGYEGFLWGGPVLGTYTSIGTRPARESATLLRMHAATRVHILCGLCNSAAPVTHLVGALFHMG